MFTYLTINDFENSQLFYRGVIAPLIPETVSLFKIIAPSKIIDAVQTPHVQTKKTTFISGKQRSRDGPSLAIEATIE